MDLYRGSNEAALGRAPRQGRGAPTGYLQTAVGWAQYRLASRGPLKRQTRMEPEAALPLFGCGTDEAGRGPGRVLRGSALLHAANPNWSDVLCKDIPDAGRLVR